MATPRKKYKIRDKDATMRALKETVGEILSELGFWELRTTAIARRLGKDKNIIRYHFGGLGQLLSAYVQEKDYWPPFFERFKPTGSVSAKEVAAVFIELMQENFRHFVADKEMQKVILWQASTSHPVMRSASAKRESAGRELIRLTDRWFVGTDVHFGAVLAIILGGTYFPILQCTAGNGECCGLDTSIARDREVLQRTIGQIIHWAWQAAEEQKKETEMKELDYEYELLENLITERNKIGIGTKTSDYRMVSEAKRLESLLLDELLRLDNEMQMRLFLKSHLNRLVGLCNLVYDPTAEVHPEADMLLRIMDELRKAGSDMLPGEMVLPRLFRDRMIREYSGRWDAAHQSLQEMGVDPILLDIMKVPLDNFSYNQREVTWKAFQYLKRYIAELEEAVKEGVIDGRLICAKLIGLGFNHVRFITYLTQDIRSKRKELDAREQREFLMERRQRILQIHRLTMLRFDTDLPPVYEEIIRWLDAEIEGVVGFVKRNSSSMKLNTVFRATQLALWQKLLYDHGIYEEANLDMLSEKTAYAFTTKGQESLSPASIKSKFYTKDAGAIKAIRKLIADMRDDLEDFE